MFFFYQIRGKIALKKDQILHMEGKLHVILYFREECYIGLSCVGWPVKHPYVPVLLGNLGHFGIVPTFHNPVDEPYLLQVLIRRPFLYSTDLDRGGENQNH